MLSRRHVLRALPAAPIIATAFASARPSSAEPATRTITVAIQGMRPTMEPADPQSMFATALRVQNSVFESLLRIDYRDNMRVRPALAVTWHQVDERNWDFQLRPDVRFHDGSPLTADDVVCSLGPERFIGPDAPGHLVHDAMQPTIEAVTRLDDRQVRITTRAPDPVFEARLAGWGAQIICAAAYRRARNWQEWAVRPVATGPYRVDEFHLDQSIMLSAHRDYWGGPPPLAGINFRAVPELSARIAGLLAGEFDLITDLTPDQFSTVEARPNLCVVGGATTITRLVNCDSWHNKQLADVNLRRAMSLAIDRKLIVDTLMGGKTTIPHGFQSEVFGPLYDATRPPLAYDPDKARDLLSRSTYHGERIAFRTTGSYYVAEMAETQALVEMWRTVGINVEIEVVENFAQVYRHPGSGLYNYSASMQYPDPLSDSWRNYGEHSQVQLVEQSWKNDEFNQLGRVLESTLDLQKRRAAFARMHEILTWDDPPALVLHYAGLFYGVRRDLNWEPIPTYPLDFGPGAVRAA